MNQMWIPILKVLFIYSLYTHYIYYSIDNKTKYINIKYFNYIVTNNTYNTNINIDDGKKTNNDNSKSKKSLNYVFVFM